MRAGACSGLPTPPPDQDPQLLWALDWLDRILTEVLVRDLDAPPLAWPAIERLYRGRPSDSAPWSILRRECVAGQLGLDLLYASDAEWMDDGMFSRQAHRGIPRSPRSHRRPCRVVTR